MADGAAGDLTASVRDADPLMKRLAVLKGKAERGQRPSDKPLGRWLGDFLDQPTETGLLRTELKLLEGCAKGADVNDLPGDLSHKESTEADKSAYGAALRKVALDERRECLWQAVSENRVRAGFLRFMILGGDKFAPVHEAGIQLWNAWVDGNVDLRSGKCVSRVALTNCIIGGDWLMQDARLDVLVLRGCCVRHFRANRATIAGAIWLDEYFISDTEVELFGIEIGGRLDCSYGHFAGGIAAPGAVIGGDLNLSCITAGSCVSFVNADIGGSLIGSGAALMASDSNGAALNISRAKIRGDALFDGANMSAAGWSDATDRRALNAQNITVGGSIKFGAGFIAKGEVNFNGAAISKALDFAGGVFRNDAGFAIRAEQSQVTGVIKFETISPDTEWFESVGCVSLKGAQCGELNCNGAHFTNLRPADKREWRPALDCTVINVAGSVSMGNSGMKQFRACGHVNFYTSHIGQHLYCGGGWFENPGSTAMYCQAIKVDGCVFLNAANTENVPSENLLDLAFKADGKVDFLGAIVGVQFICQSGRFNNFTADPSNGEYADTALNLSVSRIGDTLFLGRADESQTPPTINGSIRLNAATVRVLVDDGLVGKDGGLPDFVTLKDGKGDPIKDAKGREQKLKCNLDLDLLTYERLSGEEAYDAGKRREWLLRQPLEDLKGAFKPQPFEQLVNVMRNMGYDDDADDIALFRRKRERRSKRLLRWWRPLRPVRDFILAQSIKFLPMPAGILKFSKAAAAVGCVLLIINFRPELAAVLADAKRFLIQLGRVLVAAAFMAEDHWCLTLVVAALVLFRKFLAKLGEIAFLDWFIGYGFQMGRAVVLLLFLVFGFGWFYQSVFQQGAIVPADKDIRAAASQPAAVQSGGTVPADKQSAKSAPACKVWSVANCPGIADQAIPLFNPWLYSADAMVPVVSFGQKTAWAPNPDVSVKLPVLGTWQAPTNFVYDVQLVETVLGWVEGFLLVSFITGLIAKE
jgi:hypothetical protein